MPTNSELPRPLVLVVDDDSDTCEMYALYLDFMGMGVITARNADAGFELSVLHRPDVVVTDLLLRGTATGADLCRRLRADPRTSHIPAILLTGSTRAGTAESAIEAGCADVRIKPHLPEALLQDIRELLGRAQGQAADTR